MKNKYLVYYSMAVILSILIIPGLLVMGIRYLPGKEASEIAGTQAVYNNNRVSGEITAVDNLLTGIGVNIKNPNLENKKDIYLNIYEKSEIVRQTVVNGSVIPDGKSVKFIFEPVSGSKERTYSVEFSSPASSQEDALEVYVDSKRNPAIVAYYKPQSKMALISSIYTNWVNNLLADKGFFAFYLSVLVIFFFQIFLLIKQKS